VRKWGVDSSGAVLLGNAATAVAGKIRWNGTNFQGYTGSAWVPLDVQTTSGGGWTDGGGVVYLTTSSDKVAVGATSTTRDLLISKSSATQVEVSATSDIAGNSASLFVTRPNSLSYGQVRFLGTGSAGAGTLTELWTIGLRSPDDMLHIYDVQSLKDRVVVTSAGNVGIGATSPGGGTTVGTQVLSLAVGTAPVGGVVNQASFYAADVSASAEMFVLDEAGNATQLSPHDPKTGEWIFYSKNTKTGRVVRVNMEQLVREVEKLSGKKFMFEWIDK